MPTLVRVSGNYAHGGLGLINELVHENGHVVHMMALQTRPAFMDLGDPLFYEALEMLRGTAEWPRCMNAGRVCRAICAPRGRLVHQLVDQAEAGPCT